MKQDPLVDKLLPDPAEGHPNLTEMRGFLGKSPTPGTWRLYLTSQLNEYVEIAEADIVNSESLATEQRPLAGTRVWVKRDAKLQRTRIESRQVQAEFLQGEISTSLKPSLKPLGQLLGVRDRGGQPQLRIALPTLPGDWVLCKTVWGGYTCIVYSEHLPGWQMHDSDQADGLCAYTIAGENVNCNPYEGN